MLRFVIFSNLLITQCRCYVLIFRDNLLVSIFLGQKNGHKHTGTHARTHQLCLVALFLYFIQFCSPPLWFWVAPSFFFVVRQMNGNCNLLYDVHGHVLYDWHWLVNRYCLNMMVMYVMCMHVVWHYSNERKKENE